MRAMLFAILGIFCFCLFFITIDDFELIQKLIGNELLSHILVAFICSCCLCLCFYFAAKLADIIN